MLMTEADYKDIVDWVAEQQANTDVRVAPAAVKGPNVEQQAEEVRTQLQQADVR
jgi:heat shock protein HspQ